MLNTYNCNKDHYNKLNVYQSRCIKKKDAPKEPILIGVRSSIAIQCEDSGLWTLGTIFEHGAAKHNSHSSRVRVIKTRCIITRKFRYVKNCLQWTEETHRLKSIFDNHGQYRSERPFNSYLINRRPMVTQICSSKTKTRHQVNDLWVMQKTFKYSKCNDTSKTTAKNTWQQWQRAGRYHKD